MTLTELAYKLHDIFDFKYLTAEDAKTFYAWRGKRPIYDSDSYMWKCDFNKTSIVFEIFPAVISIDLSEYADENGDIDYSECIVEVGNDSSF